MSRLRFLWLFLGVTLVFAVPARAQRAPQFKSEVLPVLEKNCVSCHGPAKKTSGLDLSTFPAFMAGGTNGPAIAPGQPDHSLLWKVIETDKIEADKTHPANQLTDAEKQLIKAYITEGRFPQPVPEDAASKARAIAATQPAARNWWSFRKPVKPAIPVVKNQDQVQTPIDAFVLAKLEEKGWKMRPEADRVILLRRAYFDLTGLPPTPEEVKTFLNDTSPNAYEKVIDQLLASPRYGEHWGRHWLDVAGYSDSRGDAGDSAREVSWKYRDYVINAFNKNKPINQFILEQFAGDQLVNYKADLPPTPEQIEPLTATGFLRTTADITDNQTIYEVDKYFDAQQKVVDTSLSSVMGLTFGCARCHDHKFDPILQKDYFKLTASFQPVWDPENWLASNLAYGPWPSRMILDMDAVKRAEWIKGVTSNAAKEARMMEDQREATYQRFRTELKAGADLTPELRLKIRQDIADDPNLVVDRNAPKDFITDEELEAKFPELAKWREEIATKLAASKQRGGGRRGRSGVTPNYIEGVWDVSKTPSPTYILTRGNYLSPGNEVQPGIPVVLENSEHPVTFDDPAQHPEWNHTGRRLTLARWFVSPENPLVSRVFVNRVWQFHFGDGIVRSVNDFGTQGTLPTHPELLDYLAVTFQEHAWDLKWFTKQIMMSHVYRQNSAEVVACLDTDPSNKLFWRKSPLRLEAETIRDSMLQVSGLLDGEMFGAPVKIVKGADGQFLEDTAGQNRRSVYLNQARTRTMTFLKCFDAPDMTSDNSPLRFRSALPIQSLALLNSPFVMRSTQAFAQRLLKQNEDNMPEAIKQAFELAYSRPPTPEEMKIGNNVVASESDHAEGLRLFLHALVGANDFLYSF